MRTGGKPAAVALLASLALAASADADTVEVTTNSDAAGLTPPDCSLRDAVVSITTQSSQQGCDLIDAGGDDAVTFAPSLTGQTITLNGVGGEISLDNPIGGPMEIVGPGMGSLTVAADPNARVFNEPGTNTVTISGMTVTGGNPAASGGQTRGGCILNAGELILTSVRVTNCTATAASNTTNAYADGAAVGSEGGTLTLNNSLVDNNHATATNTTNNANEARARGAIYSEGAGGVTVNNSTVSGNDATATDDGAGAGNNALAVGGLANFGGGGPNVSRSTISGNLATATEQTGEAATAGGIYTEQDGIIELTTVAGNRADPTGTAATFSAGVFLSEGAVVSIRSSTIALNGPTSGTLDGVNLVVSGGTTTMTNSIVADPRGGGLNCLTLGTLASGGFNVDDSPVGDECIQTPTGTDLFVDPLLSAVGLANNGGPTQTIALQPTSPAIDKGSNAADDETDIDQRGLTRPVDFSGIGPAAGGNDSDIGAFEVQLACAGQATPSTACSSPGGPVLIPPPTGDTGKRAAALKKCKKKKDKQKRKKCIKRAKKLPV